jgi:hypothetical protein
MICSIRVLSDRADVSEQGIVNEMSKTELTLMKKICIYLLALVMVALMVVPVFGADLNETNVTPTTEIVETTTVIPATTEVVPVTTTVAITTTVIPTTTTQNATAATTAPVATVTTVPVTTAVSDTTGNITAASSPLGAALLIDGVYRGTTPVDITGISSGNHIVRLTLSGYYDYDGTVYVVPNQVTSVYGTLHPVGSTSAIVITAAATPVVTAPVPTVTVVPTTTSSGGLLESPTVLAAMIGIITACIGAIATIFPHIKKKE